MTYSKLAPTKPNPSKPEMKFVRAAVAWIASRINDWATAVEIQQLRRQADEHHGIVRAKDTEMVFAQKHIKHLEGEIELLEMKLKREFARAKSEQALFLERALPKQG